LIDHNINYIAISLQIKRNF